MARSDLHPLLFRARVAQLRAARRLRDRLDRPNVATRQASDDLPVAAFEHATPLRRRLGATDPALQESKIVNLRLAVRGLDGLVIGPGQILSFWQRVGPPEVRRGFVDGVVLVRGTVTAGTGGGLCQLSNLLYWMALHSPLEVLEQHHHSFDAFPDDERVLPFGSGASVFYNYVDLRLRNPTQAAIQVRVGVDDTHLRGQLRAPGAWSLAYAVEERRHRFARAVDGSVRRRNEIWRQTRDARSGAVISEELVTANDSVVRYQVPTGWVTEVDPASSDRG
jgi:vancomycin resistance protein VanW